MKHKTMKQTMQNLHPSARPWATFLFILLLGAALLPANRAWAASASWNVDADGANWNANTNWLPNTTFPNGIGEVATITNDITGDRIITLGQNITVGSIILGDPDGSDPYTIGANDASHTLTMDVSSGEASITQNAASGGNTFNENIALNDNLRIINNSLSQNLTFGINPQIQPISGSSNVIVKGVVPAGQGDYNNGLVLFNALNSFTGRLIIESGGILAVGVSGSLADTALGAVPGSFKADALTLDGGILRNQSVAGGGMRIQANRGITLTTNGGTLNAASVVGWSQNSGNCEIRVESVITGPGSLTIYGGDGTNGTRATGRVHLSKANTYTGDTIVAGGGTLMMRDAGSIATSPNILLAGGATLDVTNNLASEFTLGNAQTLKATGNLGTTNDPAATITMSAGRGVAMGATSGLQFTAYDGANAPLTVRGTGGSLTLAAGNVVTVTPTNQLALGSYKLVSKSGSATVAGTAPTSVTVNSPGTVGSTNFLLISSGELYLIVGEPYAVTYNGNGNDSGTAPANQTKFPNIPLTLASNTGNLATNGLFFAGWNTQADGLGIDYAEGATYTDNASLALYAKWTSQATVTYNGNTSDSGSAPVDNNSYNYNSTVTVLGNTGVLGKTGHTFTGWNTAANGSGTNYAPGDTFNITVFTTLYAQWTLDTYTVTYNGNGNTSGTAPGNQTKTYGVPLTLAGYSDLANTGYAIVGWNTQADGSGTRYLPGGTYTDNAGVTLYAMWAVPTAIYWDNTGGFLANNWLEAAHWSTDVAGGSDPAEDPGITNVATFSATPIQGTVQTINLKSNQEVFGLNVLSAVTNITLLGGGFDETLILGVGGITHAGSGSVTIGTNTSTAGQRVDITLAGSQSWANNGVGSVIINNTVSGSGSPTLTNNGTGSTGTSYIQIQNAIASSVSKIVQNSATSELRLRSEGNAFGSLEVRKGRVRCGNAQGVTGPGPLGAGTVTLGNGTDFAELLHANNSTYTYTNSIILATGASTNTIAIRGDTPSQYTATFTGGVTGNNNLTLDSATINPGDEKLTFSTGALNNSGTITHIGLGTGDLTINSVIGTNVTGVIQNSTNSRMVLAGVNTYSGNTMILAGALARGASNCIPDTSSVTLNGTAQFTATDSTFQDTIQNLTNNSTGANLTLSSLNITGTLNITAGTNNFVNSGRFATAATMIMSGNSRVALAAQGGDGLLTIGSGGLTMSGATLQFGDPGASTRTAKVVLGGDFTGSGANRFSNGNATSSGSSTNQLDLGGATRTFNITSGTTTIAPVVQNGGLIKSGAGTLTLTNANTYSGNTTVSLGTLVLTNNARFATNSTVTVAVAAGAQLQLDFTTTNTVAALVLNGIPQPAGVYGTSSGTPGFAGTGSLLVPGSSTPPPTNLTYTVSGGQLVLEWPNGLGWQLQAQTNNPAGLTTNWSTITGATSPFPISINPANPSVFFRLTYP